MLARVDDAVGVGAELVTQGGDDRGHLHEVRPGAEDVDYAHRDG
jgi:hypothetical protein